MIARRTLTHTHGNPHGGKRRKQIYVDHANIVPQRESSSELAHHATKEGNGNFILFKIILTEFKDLTKLFA